jgi:hypothetical protein
MPGCEKNIVAKDPRSRRNAYLLEPLPEETWQRSDDPARLRRPMMPGEMSARRVPVVVCRGYVQPFEMANNDKTPVFRQNRMSW